MISPFKINLGLHITDKRADGYHNLETVMYPILTGDTVTVEESQSGQLELRESGIIANCAAKDNLVVKAFQLMKSKYQLENVCIRLHKTLPFGAGIGGGSANAASVLIETNQYFNLGLTNIELESLAANIGADCPIFIQNRPQYCVGTGTEFQSIELPDLSNYHIVVIHPGFGISTAEAYGAIQPISGRTSVSECIQQPIAEWNKVLVNDFQSPMVAKYPIIGEIIDFLNDSGAVYSAMSGSGSAVFSIFKEGQDSLVIPEFDSRQTVMRCRI